MVLEWFGGGAGQRSNGKCRMKTCLLLTLFCLGCQSTRQPPVQRTQIQVARSAAKAFCAKFDFPSDKLSELDGAPLLGPVSLQREGHDVVSYRWLGGGRGDYIVQVEVYESGRIVVYGGYGHGEFGPWVYRQ